MVRTIKIFFNNQEVGLTVTFMTYSLRTIKIFFNNQEGSRFDCNVYDIQSVILYSLCSSFIPLIGRCDYYYHNFNKSQRINYLDVEKFPKSWLSTGRYEFLTSPRLAGRTCIDARRFLNEATF